MLNRNHRYFLRPEAGPVPCGKLQKRALAALKDIIGVISAAVRSAQVSSEDTIIDTNRASRIFFVSGEPGSGKSTLYLTLKEMLSDNENVSRKYCKGCEKEINLTNLKGAVRWLDTLDLEVAGDEGENLLAAVLVRLIDVLTKPDNISNTVFSKPCEEAIKELEELATDIGIAWEGNLQARAGELDPDTYSEEVMRTQRARLRVNERLKESLDKLAKNECYGCRKGTLFVLPVDDFYLKPNVSLQLLRLLRMISIPRLFFLVMGDIKTIEALFVEKSLADWTAVAGDRIFASRSDRLDEALARARELRARYLRKLLPPGQRAEIEAMDWDEALVFKPERLDGKETDTKTLEVDADADTSEEDGTLKSLLKQRNLDRPTQESSLLQFLIWPPLEDKTRQKEETEKEKKQREKIEKQRDKAREAYTALQILDATSREIMDLWFALYELKNKDESNETSVDDAPPLLSRVLDFVKLEIEEQNFLDEKQQGALSGVFPTRHYTEQEIYLAMDRLSLEPEKNTWEVPKDPSQKGLSQTEPQLWVRKHRSWKLGVNIDDDESNEDEGIFGKLPPRQTAWIVLLHDLAWKWNHERVTGNLVEKLCGALNKSPLSESKGRSLSTIDDHTRVTKISVHQLLKLLAKWKSDNVSVKQRDLNPLNDFRGWAIWRDGPTYYHFPVPDFKTFQELDRFLYVWSNGFEWLTKLQKQSEEAQKRAEAALKRYDEAKVQSETEIAEVQQSRAKGVQKAVKDAAVQRLAKESEDAKREADDAQNQAGVDISQKRSKFLSLWALAGWTVLEDKYKDFAEQRDDEWFKDFAETTGTFEERFEMFKGKLKEKGKVFEYTAQKDAEITQWSKNLNKWPEQKKEAAEGQEDPSDNRKQVRRNQPRKGRV